jgi:hypothetical protein
MALTTTNKQSAHLHTKHVYSDVRAVEGLGAGPIEERGGAEVELRAPAGS